ncbi:MAG: hypothetical protein ACLTXW_02910 [Christensenellales bacterium]
MMTYMLSSLSGCMPIAQSLLESLVIGTYPAEEDDLIAAERAYCEMEDALQDELDRYGEHASRLRRGAGGADGNLARPVCAAGAGQRAHRRGVDGGHGDADTGASF